MQTIARRRYLTNFDHHRLPHLFTDVLVLGTGVAGLRAALAAAEAGDVLILAKDSAELSCTAWAQGGIAAAIGAGDAPEDHARDTLSVAGELGDPAITRLVVSEAPAAIRELAQWGAAFDTTGADLALGREGGHSTARIIHAHGDATGAEVARVLLAQVRRGGRLRLFERCFAIDLLTHDGRVVGAVTHHPKYGHQCIWAKATILATGGAGRVYRESTNPATATGDGLALALRAGATLRDMEFMQFHPTTLYVAGAARALISEAVRGEGARLVTRSGRRFMLDYDARAELAPRDIVSRAINAEMKRESAPCVYLDARHFAPGRFVERFPHLDHLCRDFDIRPERDLIPVRPGAHYTIGGVRCDTDGRTGIRGLLACGEAACSGLHGANRLASNSLLEGLVLGRRVGAAAAADVCAAGEASWRVPPLSHVLPVSLRTELDVSDVQNSLRSLMSRSVGVERTAASLHEARESLDFWARYVMEKVFDGPAAWETQNMLTVAVCMVLAADARRESRGVHFRADYPQPDPAQRRHSEITRVGEELILRTTG